MSPNICYNGNMKKNQDNFNESEHINDTIYGVHAVVDALTENLGNKLYIQDDLRGKNVDKIKALASEKKVGISFVSLSSVPFLTPIRIANNNTAITNILITALFNLFFIIFPFQIKRLYIHYLIYNLFSNIQSNQALYTVWAP